MGGGRRRLALEDRPRHALWRVRTAPAAVDVVAAAEPVAPDARLHGDAARADGVGGAGVDIEPYLPAGARLEVFDDVGHFIERPRDVADVVLEFLS